MELRKLTDTGLEQFRGYLRELGQGSTAEPPVQLISSPEFSQEVRADIRVEHSLFQSRLDLARYLDQQFEEWPEQPDIIANDVHLWSWMSLFYFDQVCPADDKGRRKPGRDYRHIPEPGYPWGHRHLLMGAYLVYTVYGWGDELSRLLLHTALSVESQIHHQIAVRQNLITNRAIMEALDLLYYDNVHQKPKRGPTTSRNAPGSLYRFIDVIQQLDVTYDLYSMSGAEIVSLLPAEFSHWLDKQSKLQIHRKSRSAEF
jgi:hypothetical protein